MKPDWSRLAVFGGFAITMIAIIAFDAIVNRFHPQGTLVVKVYSTDPAEIESICNQVSHKKDAP